MPDSVTPSGPLSLPLSMLAGLLSQCPTFASVTESENAAEALTKIDYPCWGRDAEHPEMQIPGALISDDDSLMQTGDYQNRSQGQLILTICLPLSSSLSTQARQEMQFRNHCGAILQEMIDRSAQPDGDGQHNLLVQSWEKVVTPQMTNPDEQGESFLVAAFVIHWQF